MQMMNIVRGFSSPVVNMNKVPLQNFSDIPTRPFCTQRFFNTFTLARGKLGDLFSRHSILERRYSWTVLFKVFGS
jgi:hypothetical protein